MENIHFEIPIYADASVIFKTVTNSNDSFDVVDEVISQIRQGYPSSQIHRGYPGWGDVVKEIKEYFGEEACKYLDDTDLKECISYTGECEIDYEEKAAGDSDLLAYHVFCEFDIDRFAKKHNLKHLDEGKKTNCTTNDLFDYATLLSSEEYERFEPYISDLGVQWWLREPDDMYCASFINKNGKIYDCYGYGYGTSYCIRPALHFTKENPFSIGEMFRIGDHSFTVISLNYALCNDSIEETEYDERKIVDDLDNWFDKIGETEIEFEKDEEGEREI